MKSSVMRREGCSLKTEFIRAILAALRLASALVGQNCQTVGETCIGGQIKSEIQTRSQRDKDSQCLRGVKLATVCTDLNYLFCALASIFGIMWLQACWKFVSL